MPGHDVIVIGGSAGSLEPLTTLVEGLPPDLSAAVCVTRHTSPHARNMVPLILNKAGALPATEALDGEPLRPGHIYVAPPDYHLVVTPGTIRVSRSATETFSSLYVPRVGGGFFSRGGRGDWWAGGEEEGGVLVAPVEPVIPRRLRPMCPSIIVFLLPISRPSWSVWPTSRSPSRTAPLSRRNC